MIESAGSSERLFHPPVWSLIFVTAAFVHDTEPICGELAYWPASRGASSFVSSCNLRPTSSSHPIPTSLRGPTRVPFSNVEYWGNILTPCYSTCNHTSSLKHRCIAALLRRSPFHLQLLSRIFKPCKVAVLAFQPSNQPQTGLLTSSRLDERRDYMDYINKVWLRVQCDACVLSWVTEGVRIPRHAPVCGSDRSTLRHFSAEDVGTALCNNQLKATAFEKYVPIPAPAYLHENRNVCRNKDAPEPPEPETPSSDWAQSCVFRFIRSLLSMCVTRP